MSERMDTDGNEKACSNGLTDRYLETTSRNSPVMRRIIARYGDCTLDEYLKNLAPPATPAFQSNTDLLDDVFRYVAPLLGQEVARRTSENLEADTVVLTANHHGVDYFAQSVQGSLLFSFYKQNGNGIKRTVPIFSCGNVPLDNLTYPLGLLIYQVAKENLPALPKKLPVFSNKHRRSLVSVAGGYDEEMIGRAEVRVGKMIRDGEINAALENPVSTIFRDDYRSPAALNHASYSRQAVVLNNRIGKRIFAEPSPDIVYLELEKIVNMLLVSDLKDPDTLAARVLFDVPLRKAVLEKLNNVKSCWQLDVLRKRLDMKRPDAKGRVGLKGGGTLFFWGINDAGRRVPLYVDVNGDNTETLRGIDDHGKPWELPYTPQSIIEGLKTNRLLPSLFTCFLSLSFARGVTCVGGYYQCEYLPEMQKGLVEALQGTNGHDDASSCVKAVRTDSYLSGMQMVMARIDDEALIPAGPVEIIGSGGLTEDDREKIMGLTVKDTHIASLLETIPDLVPRAVEAPDWKMELAKETYRLLRDKVVIK